MICPRNGRWFGGCRFEARYDVPIVDTATQYPAWVTGGVVRPGALMSVYIHDICVKCGKVVERANLADANNNPTPNQTERAGE